MSITVKNNTEVSNVVGNKDNGNITVKVGKHYDKDSISFKLSFEAPANFHSIFGHTYSIGNVMRYLGYENSKPNWINKPLTQKDHMYIKRKGVKRSLPNYWNIVTFVVVSRLLSDHKLLEQVNKEFPGEELERIRIIPTVLVKRGIITEEIKHDRFNVYGIVMGTQLRLIINEFRETLGEDFNLSALDAEKVNEAKTNVKHKVIDKVFANLKSDNLMDGLGLEISNEECAGDFLN